MNWMIYPWQQLQWRQVLSQYQQNRLPHALLLCGPSGLGKGAFAQQLANLLLCQAPAGAACGNCSGCRLLAANHHPDLFKLVPEEKGKNIKIDSIRELTDSLSQTGQRAGYQVAIINPADALNKAAANALLKTLEEPEGKVQFLLISDQPARLPATIISRCQRITFSAALDANIWLQEQLQQLQITADVNLLLKMSEYAPLRALHLSQTNFLQLRENLIKSLCDYVQLKISPLPMVNEILKNDSEMWLEVFISLMNDLIRLHLNTPADYLINRDLLSSLQLLQKFYPLPSVWRLMEKLLEARRFLQMNQFHLNEQLLIESVLI
jgi:DNA polymerase III subunit delta'